MQWLRSALSVLGACLVMAGIIGITTHFISPMSTTATLVASFTPLSVIAATAATVLFAVVRRWVATGVAVAVTAVGVWSQLPLYHADVTPPAGAAGRDVRLMQANIRLGEADPAALVASVRDEDVDVLTVIELTETARSRLRDAGLDEALPFSQAFTRDGGGGAAIYARYPLGPGELLPGFELNNVRAALQVPSAGPVVVYALHPLPPYPEPSWRWATELTRLRDVFDAEERTVLVGADFNSTFDHKRFRDLLADSGAPDSPGLVDAAEHLGAGIVATFPADRPYPPVLAIDRILVRGASPVSFRRIQLPGSDHYGVVGDIRLDGVS